MKRAVKLLVEKIEDKTAIYFGVQLACFKLKKCV